MKLKHKQNRTLLMVVVTAGCINAFSQRIDKYYLNMPDRLNPTMSRKNRFELIEYFKAGQKDTVLNRFGNQVTLQELDTLKNRIVVNNTASSTFEMKLFKMVGDVQVLGIIQTVCGPICHSSIAFYDVNWHPINLQFVAPKGIEWIDADKLAKSELDNVWVKNALENAYASLTFDTSSSEVRILAVNHSQELLSDADKKQLLPLLNDKPIVYELIDRTWVRKP